MDHPMLYPTTAGCATCGETTWVEELDRHQQCASCVSWWEAYAPPIIPYEPEDAPSVELWLR